MQYENGFLTEAQRELKSKGLLRGPDPFGGDSTALGRLTGEGLRYAEDQGRDDLVEDEPERNETATVPEAAGAAASFDSTTWTGRALTSSEADELISNLNKALQRLDNLSLDNERKSQCRALLSAAKELAGAPEPPISVISYLLQNVDRIIGVAGFLIGVAGLIVTLGI